MMKIKRAAAVFLLTACLILTASPVLAAGTGVGPTATEVVPATGTDVGPTAAKVVPAAGTDVDQTLADDADTSSAGLPVSDITMNVTYGYDNTAKGGRYIPIHVYLNNTKNSPFSGYISVMSMESDYDIYRYEYPVSIGGGDTLEKLLDIPLGNRIDQIFIDLKDAGGKQILHKRVKLNISKEIPELFIGVLSDTPEKLQYLNGVGVDYGLLRTRTFSLNEENFPGDEIGLNLVDVLLISNYRIRDLSEQQNQALVEWVRGGGTMILGTGARVDDTLGRFAPELLDESYDPPKMMTVDMGQDYDVEGPGASELNMVCADFSLSGGNVIFSDDQLSLLSTVSYGKGTIAVAAYDFTDIEEFCQRNPSYMDNLLTNVLGEDKINRLAETAYSGNSNQYWSANSMINTGNVDRLPDIMLYTLEIIIYIFLVGPGIYIFLRQRDLTRYYRSGVLMLSLVFTVIIYLMGSKTRFQGMVYTYARFIDTSEDTINESTYLNIQTPYNKPFAVSLDPSYSVKPITKSYYDETKSIPKFTGQEDYKIAIRYEPNQTIISSDNVTAFEPKYFQLDRVEQNVDKIGFTGEVDMYEDKVSGSITNSFGGPVEDAALLFYDKMILLGDMAAGETKKLDGLKVLQLPVAHNNQIAEKITGGDKYSKPDIKNEDYMQALDRTNLLIYYLGNSVSTYNYRVKIVGIKSDKSNPLGLDTQEEGLTVVSSSLPVYQSEDGIVYRSALMKKPTTISGSYYSYNNTLYGIDPLVLEYSLGNDVEVEKLLFSNVSDSFTDTVKNNSLTPFTGSIFFYNHNTGSYDKMDENQKVFTRSQLEPYLSPGNTITVKYLYSNVSEYSWDILLPMLDIVGREY